MTWRAAFYLFLPLPLLAWSAAIGIAFLFWPSILLLVVVAGVIVLDLVQVPSAKSFRVARLIQDPFAIGADNAVRVMVSGPRVVADVRDEHPPVESSFLVQRTQIPGEIEYSLRPMARGDLHFGGLTLRVFGKRSLAFRQYRFQPSDAVAHVDPDIRQIGQYDALARRGQLMDIGVRAPRKSSEGTDFDRVREMTPDDPVRSINWKATARTGKMMVSELRPERSQPVIVCIDHGRLMGVAAGPLTKLDYALNAALLLAHVSLKYGDKVGLFTFAGEVSVRIPAKAGNRQLEQLLNGLRPLRPDEVESDYDRALPALGTWQRRRALMLIFTDLLDSDQARALIIQCARLRRKHLPLVVTVRDPVVEDLSHAALDSTRAVYTNSAARSMLRDREAALGLLTANGIHTLDADVRTLGPKIINAYLEIKRGARL